MLRRCIASVALLPAALIVAALPSSAPAASIVSEIVYGVKGGQIVADGTPGSTEADVIVPDGTPGSTKYAYYQLTNPRPTAIPDSEGVAIGVVPPNTVQPTDPTQSPLSVVNGSFGFDPKNLQVFLSPADPAPQILGLQFVNGGLAPGGTLDFKVSLDPTYSSLTAPPLTTVLPPGADPSTVLANLVSYTPAVANGAPPANTPEPVSLALWSALAGAGLLRARAFRRARRAAALS